MVNGSTATEDDPCEDNPLDVVALRLFLADRAGTLLVAGAGDTAADEAAGETRVDVRCGGVFVFVVGD